MDNRDETELDRPMPDNAKKNTAEVLVYRVGELEKRFDKFETELDGQFSRFENKLDTLAANFVTHKEMEAMKRTSDLQHEGFDSRIRSLEAIVKWASYIIVGAVLTALVSLVVIPGVTR